MWATHQRLMRVCSWNESLILWSSVLEHKKLHNTIALYIAKTVGSGRAVGVPRKAKLKRTVRISSAIWNKNE